MLDYFPYELREFQREFIEHLIKNIEDRHVIIHAPTGFGKTICTLAPLLKYERPIIWAVRTGNETDRVIEELKVIVKKKNINIFGLSFRGKKDMCLVVRNIKEEMDYEEASFLCRVKKKKCKYYKNLRNFDFYDIFTKEPKLYSEILIFGEENELCPYFLQVALLPFARVVSLSYNYIFNVGASWVIKSKIKFKKSFLVIDEAHNLQKIITNLNSDKITINGLKRARKEVKEQRLREFIDRIIEFIEREAKSLDEEDKEIKKDKFVFDIGVNLKITKELIEVGEETRRKMIAKGKAPRSSAYKLGNFLLKVLEYLDVDGTTLILGKDYIEFFDMRSGEVLKEYWDSFYRIVFMSGTINPIDAFAENIGINNYAKIEFPSFYKKDNVQSFVTRDLQTRGEEISSRMAKKYIYAIEKFSNSLKDKNIAVFCASYRIMEKLLENGLKEVLMPREIFIEKEGMRGDEARRILENFKKCSEKEKKGVLIASAQGRFAEGADFPGKELEGIFLVGIPFDRLTAKTRVYIEYYQKIYGKIKGKFYAYILPALKRASQALGRCLRSRDDRAVFVLGDSRYEKYIAFLPDYVRRNYKVVDSRRLSFHLKKLDF